MPILGEMALNDVVFCLGSLVSIPFSTQTDADELMMMSWLVPISLH